MSEKNNEFSFEDAIEQLEEIVAKLEEGDVPLEKAIDYYQQGMKLSKFCNEKLTKVEKQMEQILAENGEFEAFSPQAQEE